MLDEALKLAVEHFDRDGYCVLRGLIAEPELVRLRDEADAQLDYQHHNQRPTLVFRRGIAWKLDHISNPLIAHVNDSCGLVLAHPRLIAAVQAILGPRICAPAQSMTFKHGAGGAPVPRHRDTFLNDVGGSQPHIVLTADIFLDRATAETGCLHMAPGSHRLANVSDLVNHDPDDWSDLVPVPAEPGDVVLHNDLTVHGSPPSPPTADGKAGRRVVLCVFVDPQLLTEHGYAPGMPPPSPAYVTYAAATLRYWVARRHEVYGDVDYQVPPWPGDDGGAVNFADPPAI